MYIFGTQVDNDADNQVEFLDTESKAMFRMGPSSKPPGVMDRLNECSTSLNDNQIVHFHPRDHMDILDLDHKCV